MGLELQSGGLMAAWGVFALAMVDLDRLPSYGLLTEHIPGCAWGWAAIVVGAAQLAVATLDLRRLRWCLALAAGIVWSALATGLFRGPVMGPNLVLNAGMALGNLPGLLLLRPRWR